MLGVGGLASLKLGAGGKARIDRPFAVQVWVYRYLPGLGC